MLQMFGRQRGEGFRGRWVQKGGVSRDADSRGVSRD